MPRVLAVVMMYCSISCQLGIGIHIIQRSEQLLLGAIISAGAVAADAHTDGARRASLSLSLPDCVQDALAHSVQGSIHPAKMGQLTGNRVLDIHVLAASSLEQQLDLDFIVIFPLVPMQNGRAGPEIISAVFPGNRIDRVGSQFAKLSGFGHRLLDLPFHNHLVRARRCMNLKRQHPRILTDGPCTTDRHIDVGSDDVQR